MTELRPAEPLDPAASLTGPAGTLARAPGVVLPDSAVADLAAGRVVPVVVTALLELARKYELSVCVFRSGHPEQVFGTGRTSNHTRGRAVDVWAVDGKPVVTMDRVTVGEFLAAARATGADEVGGPIDPDGPGGVHFTDQVHHDHVHIGFSP